MREVSRRAVTAVAAITIPKSVRRSVERDRMFGCAARQRKLTNTTPSRAALVPVDAFGLPLLSAPIRSASRSRAAFGAPGRASCYVIAFYAL